EAELVRDLLVLEPRSREAEDLLLALGERRLARGAARLRGGEGLWRGGRVGAQAFERASQAARPVDALEDVHEPEVDGALARHLEDRHVEGLLDPRRGPHQELEAVDGLSAADHVEDRAAFVAVAIPVNVAPGQHLVAAVAERDVRGPVEGALGGPIPEDDATAGLGGEGGRGASRHGDEHSITAIAA